MTHDSSVDQENKDRETNAFAEMKFLARTWVDDFEKQTFNGKTLDEVINRVRYE